MKYIYFAASSLVLASSTIQQTSALKKFLSNIPNGESFTQPLGHPGSDETKFTDFATAFKAAAFTWTDTFCQADFPGAKMTNGEAFGDPCCTWKKGGTPDHTVTAFTTSPTTKTVCASAASPKPAATSATPATTPTPAASSDKPAATVTPSAPTTETPAAPTKPAATKSPVVTAKPSTGSNSSSYEPGKVVPDKGGCAIKDKGKGKGGKGGKGKGGKGGKGSSGDKGGKGDSGSKGGKGGSGGKGSSSSPTPAPKGNDEKQTGY